MKVLVIGDPNSLFIQNYVKNLKEIQNLDLEIDLLGTFQPFRFGESGKNFQKTFLLPPTGKVYANLRLQLLFRVSYLFWFLMFKIKGYDVIHCFYAYKDYIFFNHFFQGWNGRLVVTIYGSDFYNIKPRLLPSFMNFFKRADKITFANPKTMFDFQTKFKLPSDKLIICRFGLEPLKELKRIKEYGSRYAESSLEYLRTRLLLQLGITLTPFSSTFQ